MMQSLMNKQEGSSMILIGSVCKQTEENKKILFLLKVSLLKK